MTKRIAILGSTGSIGRQALQVIDDLGPEYRVVALTAGSNARLLGEQARRYQPEMVALSDPGAAQLLKRELGSLCRVEAGPSGLLAAAAWPAADLVLNALVGFSGLEPSLAALEAGKRLALANKEALVAGGALFACRGFLRSGSIIPVDSEHSAIWQCLAGADPGEVEGILLTASGGPFLDWPEEKLASATARDALRHPNWAMGEKITIDSATLMNKGLEVIEAHWLFGLSYDRIRVLIHPQSIVHSLVEFVDGGLLAQLGVPDMRLPIQYALTYPERKGSRFPRLKLAGRRLDFWEPDQRRFPCLALGYQAGRAGGTAAACLNAANEVAVDNFRRGVIKFNDIPG